jgi:hypothetical protein
MMFYSSRRNPFLSCLTKSQESFRLERIEVGAGIREHPLVIVSIESRSM